MNIVTNSKIHPKGHASRFKADVPNPLSTSFIRQQALYWSFRAFSEAKDCFSKRGFVLFDTLTLDDEHLVWFHDYEPKAKYTCWDYPCFCSRDLQLFLKRLRQKLHWLAFDIDGNFRYIITSEYGSSQYYTHRPHYHCLFL